MCCGTVGVVLLGWHCRAGVFRGGDEGSSGNGGHATDFLGWRRYKWKGCWWAGSGVGGASVLEKDDGDNGCAVALLGRESGVS